MIKKLLSFILIGLFSLFSFVAVYGGDDMTKPDFSISPSGFTPGAGAATSGSMSTATNKILENVIDSLIIAFGVLSLLVMSIGAGYMVIYSGQDELLSKGKKIFTGGLISLAIALLSGLIVTFLQYLLYI